MKSPEEFSQRWLHPAVFAIWTIFLIYLLVSQRYTAFLRPEFGLILALAHFIALGFMLAAIVRPRAAAMNLSTAIRAAILLMPIYYWLVMPNAVLGNQAFKKRFTGASNQALGWQDSSKLFSRSRRAQDDADLTSRPGEIESAQPETPQERTILDILLDPERYQGQRLIITGMILRDDQLKMYFGGRNTAVYRFLINCCAADAVPLAIALDLDPREFYSTDQWVQVEGIFVLRHVSSKPVPTIAAPRITPIEAPDIPYLF